MKREQLVSCDKKDDSQTSHIAIQGTSIQKMRK